MHVQKPGSQRSGDLRRRRLRSIELRYHSDRPRRDQAERRQSREAHTRGTLCREQSHSPLQPLESDVSPGNLNRGSRQSRFAQPHPRCAAHGPLFRGNDHVIEYNEIHHVCEESNDAGAIYSGRDWTMRGTVIRYNYLHHICGFEGRGCVGVYLDDMFCGTLIYGNVFFDVTRAAFIGGGRDCSIENNIFVDCNPAIHIDARAAGWANYHVDTTMTDRLKNMPYRRRPWSKRYPELLTILKDQPEMPKDNVVTHNICSGGKWDEITGDARQFACLTKNLIDDNPGFRNAGKNDFRLKEDSLAFDFGFVKIPVEEIGLTTQRRGK